MTRVRLGETSTYLKKGFECILNEQGGCITFTAISVDKETKVCSCSMRELNWWDGIKLSMYNYVTGKQREWQKIIPDGTVPLRHSVVRHRSAAERHTEWVACIN